MGNLLSFKKFPNKSLFGSCLVVLALALYLGVAWYYITQSYQKQPLQTGRLATVQSYGRTDYAKSLDLRIAAKASYPSGVLTTVKDLGATDGIRKQIISFKVTLDGLTEYGLMYLPAAKAPQVGYPVLILCHGYYDPDQYDTTTGYLDDMQFYAKAGFAVIKPDYRGQGLSVAQGQPEGAFYSMAYNTDVLSLVSAVKDTSNLNGNNISLWGHSMGAYVALRAGVLSPDIKNIILLSAHDGTALDLFSDYTSTSDQDNPVALKLREALLIKYGTPVTDPSFWNAASPLSYMKKLKANVEINVGQNDIVVPPKFSQDLDAALSQAGKTHQYFIYAGADHGLIEQRELIWQRSLQLLQTGSITT